MTGQNILVIEDEKDIQELIKFNLTREGYSVATAHSGEEGLSMARKLQPDLVLLDLMLPGIDGINVCRILKTDETTRSIPILMLTARTEESDIVTGLEVGADDYMTKPFSTKVLVARVKAVIRRHKGQQGSEDAAVTAGEIAIDPGRHEVRVAGERVDLTPTEFQILYCLAQRPGWVFSRYQIVNEVRGSDTVITDRAVDVQIVGLRKKLGEYGKYIETVRGVGYRFRDGE